MQLYSDGIMWSMAEQCVFMGAHVHVTRERMGHSVCMLNMETITVYQYMCHSPPCIAPYVACVHRIPNSFFQPWSLPSHNVWSKHSLSFVILGCASARLAGEAQGTAQGIPAPTSDLEETKSRVISTWLAVIAPTVRLVPCLVRPMSLLVPRETRGNDRC